MGEGQLDVGRPDAMVEAGYQYFKFCGGAGGGGCLTPLGATGVVLSYRLQKFIVRNRRIVFENKEFYGVDVYTDAGPAGSCSYSLGSRVNTYMALSIDGGLTNAEVQERGVVLTGELPYDIEFLQKDIPQPYENGWADHIFVHLYWGNSGYLNNNVSGEINNYAFRIKKHDYDVRL